MTPTYCEAPVYCMPGMATDYRIFQRLHIGPLHFMHWIPPRKKEGLQDYVYRMTEQIQHPNPIIIGVSFGGLLGWK